MGRSQRTKGHAFEREVVGALRDQLGAECVPGRRLGQARDSGCDVPVVHPSDGVCLVDVECKRGEQFRSAWLDQAQERAEDGALAVVCWRQSRGSRRYLVVLEEAEFCEWVREML